MTVAAFFTVCGGGEDYEFLLGSLWHHAEMGNHVVLDTTPEGQQRTFRNLPPHVIWIYEPKYGQGWKEFRFRDALTRAAGLAKNYGDVVICLDCDEFYSRSIKWILEDAAQNPLYVETIHWRYDPAGIVRPYMFGESEWHLRMWPAKAEVSFPPNEVWVTHPNYNGNDHHHAVPRFPAGTEILKAPGLYHHHVHHALGEKSRDDSDASRTIPNWGCGVKTIPVKWPTLLATWREAGIRPSTHFQ